MELNLIALVRCTARGSAAFAEAAGTRGKYRLAGGKIGRSLGGRISGHQIRRGRLFAAIAVGTGTIGIARVAGLPGAGRAQGFPTLSVGRFGRPARRGAASRGGREDHRPFHRKNSPDRSSAACIADGRNWSFPDRPDYFLPLHNSGRAWPIGLCCEKPVDELFGSACTIGHRGAVVAGVVLCSILLWH